MYRVIAKFVTITVHIRTLQNGLIHQATRSLRKLVGNGRSTVGFRFRWQLNKPISLHENSLGQINGGGLEFSGDSPPPLLHA